MSPIQYPPLNGEEDIRLIILYPAESREAPLLSELIVVSLSSGTIYYALSYTWGSDEKTHSLSTSDGDIPITGSLASALFRFRSTTEKTLLWVDAVCIDQSNDREKADQIRLMRAIYEKAE